MKSYLQRYQQYRESSRVWHEEARLIWAELVSYGATIRTEPLYSEAHVLAHAMMTRARHNIELLFPRLQQLGYAFAEPDRAWLPPRPEYTRILNEIEQTYGLLPLLVRMWFEVVGSVNLAGFHPKLSSYVDLDDLPLDQLRDGDPLVVDFDLVASLQYEPPDREAAHPIYELAFAPDGAGKTGSSGGGAMVFQVPNPAFDAPILDPGRRWSGTFFVHHIQTCFEWGGFPGLRGGWFPGEQTDPASSKAELDFLTENLLPII